MKFTILAVAVACTLTSTVSAWHLELFDKELYQSRIVNREGTLGQPCAELPASADNKASSMRWATGFIGAQEIVLYQEHGCVAEVGRSRGAWSLPQFSSFANNKVSSYKIN